MRGVYLYVGRSLLALLALVLIGVGYVALNVTDVARTIRELADLMEAPAPITFEDPLSLVHMETLDLTKTLPGGTVVTRHWVQGAGESLSDFLARVRAEWAKICEALGGE